MPLNGYCPYCGTHLNEGKLGNMRTCLLCEKSLCENCIESGICSVHFINLTSEQIEKVKKNNQNYNLTKISPSILVMALFFTLIILLRPLSDKSFLLGLGLLLAIGTAIIIIVGPIKRKIDKTFTKKMRTYFK
jgi:hypothetical protein